MEAISHFIHFLLTIMLGFTKLSNFPSPCSAETLEQDRFKRSVDQYKVEGCFNGFANLISKDIGHLNSNLKCQEVCRDQAYILAATKGNMCYCGNVYPKGNDVPDSQCRVNCRPYTTCYNAQECCGGTNAYSVSAVGDIIVSKQVLRRIANKWQTDNLYRNHMSEIMSHQFKGNDKEKKPFIKSLWGMSIKECFRSFFIHKNGKEYCKDSPAIVSRHNNCILSFVTLPSKETIANGFSCSNGRFLRRYVVYPYSSKNGGYKVTYRCCRPKTLQTSYSSCFTKNLGTRKGYYLVSPSKECLMGNYTNPLIRVKIKDASGKFQECEMKAEDKTPKSDTYKCKTIKDFSNLMKLKAISFKVEDETQPTVSKPERVKNFFPAVCLSSNVAYKCKKSLTTTVSRTTGLTIGTGFDMGVSFGGSFGTSAEVMGVGASQEFNFQVSSSFSFNTERSTQTTKEISDTSEVEVDVPAGKQVTIDLLRKKVDITYKWKAEFKLLGVYQLEWDNGEQSTTILQDVTTALSGAERNMHALGVWKYPNTDVLQVLVTDNYGKKIKTGCEHQTGKNKLCKV